jgi:hypothetical protein
MYSAIFASKGHKYEEEQKRKAQKEKRKKDNEKSLEQMFAESRAYLLGELAKLPVWTPIPWTAAKLDYVEVQIGVDAANITTILSAVY